MDNQELRLAALDCALEFHEKDVIYSTSESSLIPNDFQKPTNYEVIDTANLFYDFLMGNSTKPKQYNTTSTYTN